MQINLDSAALMIVSLGSGGGTPAPPAFNVAQL